MDTLRCLKVFMEVAQNGSFAAAATKLNMSRASVTKHVANLEYAFKGPLLSRTTRKVILTDTGAEVFERCEPILNSFENLVSDVHSARNEVTGLIRVEAPPIFGARYLLPQITKFSEMYPGIEVLLSLSDASRDFRAKGTDLFIGFYPMGSTNCTSMDLIRLPQIIVATPDYIARRGLPKTPSDLASHNCLLHTQKAPDGIWRFADGKSVPLHGTIRSNHGEAIKQATLLGHGVSMFPYYFVEKECKNGSLQILLEDTPPVSLQFSAVHESRRVLPLRTKKFIDCLKKWASSEVFPVPAQTRGEHQQMALAH